MTETKHSPGPWGIEWTETTAWIGPMRQDGSGKVREVVASIDREGLTDEALDRNDARARLISSAPELLEMLERCQKYLHFIGSSNNPLCEKIAALLAKAKGCV